MTQLAKTANDPMDNMTRLEKVAYWHKLAGVEASMSRASKQRDFFYSEMDEWDLSESLSDRLDAIGDMLFVKLGYEYHTGDSNRFGRQFLACCVLEFEMILEPDGVFPNPGYDIVDEIFEEVLKSNLTKFCYTDGEAEQTVNHYKRIGLETFIHPVDCYFVIKSSKDQENNAGDFSFKGKVLKSINFKEPDFTDIIARYPGIDL